MNEAEIIDKLAQILERVTKKEVDINIDTDLIQQNILDSLDGMVFTLEVEQAFNTSFPENINLVKEGYYKVGKLVEFLQDL
jgi:acyl carrier protein